MATFLSDLIESAASQYKLKVVAGTDFLSVPVSWVHLVEDTAVAPYFWGGELVVTTGVHHSETDYLIHLAKGLLSSQVCGVLVNTGRYINDIPQHVIDFYTMHKLPLITMPWEIHLSDVIKDFCMKIVVGTQSDMAISKAIIQAIETPHHQELYLPTLSHYYNIEGTFQTVAFRIDFPEGTQVGQRVQAADILRTLLSRTIKTFSLLQYEKCYVLVLNDPDDSLVEEVTQQIVERCQSHTPALPVHIGIGTKVKEIQNLGHSYRKAKAATKMADYFGTRLVDFSTMGLYQLLFSLDDPSLLESFYWSTLGKLEEYDKKHESFLTQTLYYDLKYSGSIKEIAAAMYTHRNTVNYRLRKIRSLLGTDLEDAKERTQYRLAFYIREILTKKAEKYGRREGSPDPDIL